MLSKPRAGWTNVAIGDFNRRASYLTDVPMDFLAASIHALSRNRPFVQYFDAEGDEFYITSYHGITFINKTFDSGFTTWMIEMGHVDLIADGVKDIVKDLGDWVKFTCADDKHELFERLLHMQASIRMIHDLMPPHIKDDPDWPIGEGWETPLARRSEGMA